MNFFSEFNFLYFDTGLYQHIFMKKQGFKSELLFFVFNRSALYD